MTALGLRNLIKRKGFFDDTANGDGQSNIIAACTYPAENRIQSEACIGCAACVAVCLTDTIRMEDINGIRELHTWNTSVPLHACPGCGDPFAPEPMVFLKEEVPVCTDSWGLCPKCRRRATLKQWDFA